MPAFLLRLPCIESVTSLSVDVDDDVELSALFDGFDEPRELLRNRREYFNLDIFERKEKINLLSFLVTVE